MIKDGTTMTSVPSSAEINSLPHALRQYIHDLETRCDPAGEVREWRLTQAENEQLRAKVVELEAVCESNAKCNDDMEKAMLHAQAERDKLQAFKDWVHRYLDGKGVPHHPPGPHGAEGCRIGDRMDWVWSEIDRLRQAIVNPWIKVACRRGDGSKTGRFNVARRKGEFQAGNGSVHPLWEHYGAGDFTEEEANSHVARLNAELAQ